MFRMGWVTKASPAGQPQEAIRKFRRAAGVLKFLCSAFALDIYPGFLISQGPASTYALRLLAKLL
jgi:hypothetical protein